MIRYQIRVLDEAGALVVGASLRCVDDTAAVARFAVAPLPRGRAELWRGNRVVARREANEEPVRTMRRQMTDG